MDFLKTQKRYWDELAGNIGDDIGCTHNVKPDNTPMDEIVFSDIAKYLNDNFLKDKVDGEILEIGCGNGLILLNLSNLLGDTWNLSGVDISENMLERTLVPNASLYCCDAQQIPIKENKFDLIFLHSVVQYFDNEEYLKKVINECERLLKKDGSICLMDVPLIWYKEFMVSKRPKNIRYFFSKYLSLLKPIYKALVKSKPIETTMTINVSGTNLNLPIFKGFWVDPDKISKEHQMFFRKISVEVQPYISKALVYRRFRFNIIFSGKM